MEVVSETNTKHEPITTEDSEGVDVPPETKQCRIESTEDQKSTEQLQITSPSENIKVSEAIDKTHEEEMEVDGTITDRIEETNNEITTVSQETTGTLDCPEIQDCAVIIEDVQNKQVDGGKRLVISINAIY